MQAAGVDADITVDIRRTQCGRVRVLERVSGVTAVSRQAGRRRARGSGPRGATMEASMLETLRLANVNGVALPESFVAAQMQFLDTLPEGIARVKWPTTSRPATGSSSVADAAR